LAWDGAVEAAVEQGRKSARRQGCLVAAMVGLGIGLFIVIFLSACWDACGAGDAGGFNRGFLIVYGALAAFLTGAAFWIVAMLLRRLPLGPRLIASAAIASLVGYVLFVWWLPASPSGPFFPNGGVGTCPGNVPPWWPSWLPI
jgi:hypothetical protein